MTAKDSHSAAGLIDSARYPIHDLTGPATRTAIDRLYRWPHLRGLLDEAEPGLVGSRKLNAAVYGPRVAALRKAPGAGEAASAGAAS